MPEIFGAALMGGGGGSGGTLTVTGVAGHTVTVTKDGKTYTRTFNSSGVAVFKGLSTGTWTLTMTGDGQTATFPVDVTADYAVTITYFSATINVTYPAGSTCKATHTDGIVLNAPDTSGTWACVVPKSGTWTILAQDTSAGKSKSVDVNITTDGQSERVTLSYWDGTLFDNGNQYSEITGGWTGVSGNKLVSKNGVAWVSNNKISVKDFNTIHFIVDGYSFNGNGANGWLGLYDTNTPSDNNVSVSHLVIGSAGTYTIDVSSLTGSYYVRGNVSKWSSYYGTETVSKIWLT